MSRPAAPKPPKKIFLASKGSEEVENAVNKRKAEVTEARKENR